MTVKDLGATMTLTFTIIDPDTNLKTTPAARVLTTTDPAGNVDATWVATVVSAGVLRYKIPTTLAGVWRYRLVTTTPNDARDGAWIGAALLGDLAWLPNVTEVGDWIPERTLAVASAPPDSDSEIGTFNADTRPTGAQVDQLIFAAASLVAARCGTIDPSLYGLAGKAAAVRAAAFVEVTYPQREGGTNQYEQLLQIADSMLDGLAVANLGLTGTAPGGDSSLLPVYSFPDPGTWSDTSQIY